VVQDGHVEILELEREKEHVADPLEAAEDVEGGSGQHHVPKYEAHVPEGRCNLILGRLVDDQLVGVAGLALDSHVGRRQPREHPTRCRL